MNLMGLQSIFMPSFMERSAPIFAGKRLVHYTSAEAAFAILEKRAMRLRNATLMNDFSEIEHGLACLNAGWNSEAGALFQNWIETRWPGLKDEIVALFEGHAFGIRNRTFITSLSEHESTEDNLGRLSMWRAYGGKAGIALVLKPTIFAAETDHMKIFSAPVVYHTTETFAAWFTEWTSGLVAHSDTLQGLDPEELKAWLFHCFRSFCLCVKHPGFREEKEWRVFHSPDVDGASKWLTKKIGTIRGVPQEFVEVALEDDDELGIVGVAPKTLIDRVIIGPCEAPLAIHYALLEALNNAGVEDAASKIWASAIPLRHQ